MSKKSSKYGKRLLAGILCAVMLFTNSAVRGISAQAAEVNPAEGETPAIETSNEGVEPEGEARLEEQDGQKKSEETSEKAEDTSDEETDKDETKNPVGGNQSGEMEDTEGEDGKEEDTSHGENSSEDDATKKSPSEEEITDEKSNTEGEEISEQPTEKDSTGNEAELDELLSVSAEERLALMSAEGDIASGTSNDIAWVINKNGKLIAEGNGDFTSVMASRAPWYSNNRYIISAEINIKGMTDASYMFAYCLNLQSVDLRNFDTSNVTNMYQMFYYCSALQSLDLRNFDTGNVTDMSYMFWRCSSLQSLDLRGLNTGNVTDMSYMFNDCSALQNLGLSDLNVGNVTDMSYMFNNCSALQRLDLRNFDTINVTNMSHMFCRCSALQSLNLDGLNTDNVTDMSYMFYRCSNLESVDLSEFNTSKVVGMREMFSGCSNLLRVNLSSFDTSNVTNMASMFCECSNLASVDVSGFNTGNVTDMYGMFYDCSSLASVDVSGFNTGNVTSMASMFYDCNSLASVDMSGFNTGNVTNMYGMFYGCGSLESVDVSSFDTRNVTDMYGMFYGCSSLESVDVSGFDTSNVTGGTESFPWASMAAMFANCSSLTSLDVSNFDTSNVIYMSEMFSGCSSLTSLDLSGFDTGRVVGMSRMFSGCNNLLKVSLNSFDTSNVKNMASMFYDCSSLSSIDISSFDTSNLEDMQSMFYNCNSLVSLDLSSLDLSSLINNATNTSNVFTDCDNLILIYSPYNLSPQIVLPYINGDIWYRSDGTTVTPSVLPQNLSYSVALGKNYIPEEKEIKPTIEEIEITKDKLTIVIHDENTKAGIEGAVVTVNNTSYPTSADGIALINASDEKVRTEITVSAEGYEDLTTVGDTSNGMILHILMIPKSDDLRVTNVVADMDGQKYDLLREKVVLGYYNDLDELSNRQNGSFTFTAETNHDALLYELLSGDGTVAIQNTSGTFTISTAKGGNTPDGGTIKANMPLESALKQGKYKLRVTDGSGHATTIGIGLTCTVNYLTIERETISGKFALGNDIEVQVPDDVPLIGGGTFKFGLEDKLPIDISIDGDGKLKVAFNKPVDQDFNQYKENYKRLSQKAKNASQLASQFGHVKGFNAGYFDIDGSICGYGEGNISELDKGTITIKVGVIAALEGTGGFKQYFMVGPVSVNFFLEGEASVSADANASVSVKNWNITGFDLTGGSLTGKVGITVGGGVGVGVELNASGNGNVNYTWKPAKEYQKAWLEASAKVEAVVLWWTQPLWESGKFTYIIIEKNGKQRSMSDAVSVQKADFVPMSRNYLDYSEGFLHMMSADTNSVSVDSYSEDEKTIVKAAVYPSASPAMIQVGDTSYLFWVEDIVSRDANNIGAIVYSTSQNGAVWSNPKRLILESEDSTFDGSFSVATSDSKIYITWQDGTSVLEDNATMQQVLQSMTIRRAVLDTQSEEVTVTDNLTKENGYYMYPCTVVQSGACYTAYVQNTLDSGDIYGKNTQNLCCIKEGNKQPEIFGLPENSIVVNMSSGIFDNSATIVCEIDTDGSLSTSEDREIYLWDMANGSQARLTNNATADYMPVISDSGSIYWYHDGNIMQLKNKSANAQGIWSEPALEAPVYFNIITGQDNRDIVLWEMPDADKSDGAVAIYGSREMDNGTWQSFSKCAQSQGTIVSRPCAVGDWEHLQIAHLEGIFLEDGTLLKDLCVLGRKELTDVSLDYVDFDESQVSGGGLLPMQAGITNHGNTVIDSLQFTVDGTAVENISPLNLQPGESREITIDGFTVPTDIMGKREVVVCAVVQGDQNDSNNQQNIFLETTRYKIATATRLDRGGTWLDFTVWNEGEHSTSGTVRVHKSTENGDIIYETDFHALPTEHGYSSSVDLSSYENSATHYYVETLPDHAEYEEVDNEFVYIGYGTGVEEQIETDVEPSVDSIALSDTETWLKAGESMPLFVTTNSGTVLSGGELLWSSYDVSIASVDNNGNITAHRNGTTYITATYGNLYAECAVHVGETSVKTYSITFDTQGGELIKSITGLHAGDIITLPENANKEGMIFLGWYTQAVDGEKLEDSTIVVQKSVTLYAHWGEVESANGFWVTSVSDQIYTGNAIKPKVRVYDGRKLLEPSKDYTISYANNINANDASDTKKAPTITIKGKGNYTGRETLTFKILPVEFSADNLVTADLTKVYNKKIQKPIPSIMVNGRRLKNNKDFTVTYPDDMQEAYQAIGTYRIVVTGKGNYTGEQTLTFDITDKILLSRTSITKIPKQAYTGNAVTPKLVVKYKKVILAEHKDYELEFQNNVNIGKATVIITGKGDYVGKKTITFQITGGSLKKAKVTGLISPVIYTGDEIWQNCTLTMKVNGADIVLLRGKDYTVTYQNNVKAGIAKVIYTGINGYTGTLQKSYKIVPYNILANDNGYIKYTKDMVCAYLKGGCRPEPDIYFKDTLLKKGVDYTLSYKNNNAVNGSETPTIVIKGKGSFKDKFEIPFTITPQNLANMTLAPCDKIYKNKSNIYRITPKLLDINGKALNAGKDFDKKSITYTYGNDVALENGISKKAGDNVESTDIIPANTQICVSLTCGNSNLYEGTFTGAYRIAAADIKSAKVTISSQIYTGSEITPDKTQMTVKLFGTELSSEDYDILSYSNNVKKGKASVTIKGKGNYGGTKTVKFTIRAKGFLWWWC